MSRLLLCPATWPHLALNPEPRGTAADPEAIGRLFEEWFGPRPLMLELRAPAPEPAPPAVSPRRLGYRPSTLLHQPAIQTPKPNHLGYQPSPQDPAVLWRRT